MNTKNIAKFGSTFTSVFWIFFAAFNVIILLLGTHPNPESILGDAFARTSLSIERSQWFFILFMLVLGVGAITTLFPPPPQPKKSRPIPHQRWLTVGLVIVSLVTIFLSLKNFLPWFGVLTTEGGVLGLWSFSSHLPSDSKNP